MNPVAGRAAGTFGGYTESGSGSEGGLQGLAAYCRVE